MKKILKKIARKLPFAVTKNIYYDKLTEEVIKKCCKPDTNCIDVGCHRGEIMDLMMAAAPQGKHYGFEPIPELYCFLKKKYKGTTNTISETALSDKNGIIHFNYVISNPSYSGIKKRQYDRNNEKDTLIDVHTERLDNILNENYEVGLMKIDVEGAELLVLKGAEKTISRCKPVIIFEFGLGASDIYGANPKLLWKFFDSIGYKMGLLDQWLKDQIALSLAELEEEYYQKNNHYFIAWSA
jgi:FkbM family methyltransferase